MIDVKVGRGFSDNLEEAFEEATKDFIKPKLLIYYTSEDRFKPFSKMLQKKFNNCIIIGNSAHREICKYGFTSGALLVMDFEDGIECHAGIIKNVNKYPIKYVGNMQKALDKFENTENTICFEFCIGTANSEEKVLSTITSVLKSYNIPLAGGSSAASQQPGTTYVGLNGEIYDNECVFVLIKNLGGRVKIYRENIFKSTGKIFTATRVDLKNRIVHELDGKPAAEILADALNVPVNELESLLFLYHPLGRVVGNNVYISTSSKVIDNKSVSYFSRVYTNCQVLLLEREDYKKVLNSTISKILSDFEHISCSLVINCMARTAIFEKENFAGDFSRKLGELGNYIGYSSYGEQMNDQHFNQTMVLCAFE
ncbi:FIST signal transduction protein [Clostridium luticellarii]|uniref:FIST N domain protein n=1 Tax=Clostridium luticellarii TaxID=1691940 RepID=A0A2T0BIF4_9CLOT|nr:FIST N-terminal domain-containing protein [Clostridium luticellarii]PRR83670.1 FIST N domain protein [Clostridium luticellarii]